MRARKASSLSCVAPPVKGRGFVTPLVPATLETAFVTVFTAALPSAPGWTARAGMSPPPPITWLCVASAGISPSAVVT